MTTPTRTVARGALAALAALILAAPAAAQRGDTGSGPTPMGREGAVWQTDIELAKEQLRELAAELDREPLETWKERSLAWIELELGEEEEGAVLHVPSSWHVGDLEASRADVTGHELEFSPWWEVRWKKKPPATLTLVLSDDQATKVDCPLRSLVEESARGWIGVFLVERTVHCLPRTETAANPAG